MFDGAYVSLYEVALYIQDHDNDATEADGLGFKSFNDLKTLKTRLLFSCLEASKNLLTRYLSLPDRMIRIHTTCEKVQAAHAMMVLLKLSLCIGNSAEGLRFRQACDVKYYYTAFATRLGALTDPASAAADTYPDCFWQIEQTLRRVATWYEQFEVGHQSATPQGFVDSTPLRILNLSEEAALKEALELRDLDLMFFSSSNFWQ
jgi:hypothetical protein